jgi:hypothetical protein
MNSSKNNSKLKGVVIATISSQKKKKNPTIKRKMGKKVRKKLRKRRK